MLVMHLDEMGRVRITSSIDIFVAVFIILIGISVIIIGISYFGEVMAQSARYSYYSSYSYNTPGMPIWYWAFPLFIIFLGIATIIYGIKRIIDNSIKIKQNTPYKVYQPPTNNTPVMPPNQQY